ncbi:MAG: glycosyl hydrolase family 18 protein [Nocardioides sp.]
MRRLLALVLTAALLVAAPSAPAASGPAPAARSGASLVVTGYAMVGLRAGVIRRDAHALDLVGVSSLTILPHARNVERSYAGLRRLARLAHARGLRAELLVSNWSAATGDSDSALVSRFLASAGARSRAASRLARIARREGWDGLTIDLEAMHSRDRDHLVRFLRMLRRRLPAPVELSMDIGARTSLASYRRSGFDLRRLARVVDRIALMTYDQHGASWSGPGPIGAIPWQRRTMRVLIARVPRGMVDLGIAGYGYTWPSTGTGRSLSPRRARALVAADGATAIWHRRAAEWSATLSNDTVLWWSDARSYRRRVRLARALGVHGVALWVLGSADPLPDLLARGLRGCPGEDPVHPVVGGLRARGQLCGRVPAAAARPRGLAGVHRALLQPHRVRRLAGAAAHRP